MLSENWAEDLKTDIRRRRLDALKRCNIDFKAVFPSRPRRSPWQAPSYFHWMETWSEMHAEVVNNIEEGVARFRTANIMRRQERRRPRSGRGRNSDRRHWWGSIGLE